MPDIYYPISEIIFTQIIFCSAFLQPKIVPPSAIITFLSLGINHGKCWESVQSRAILKKCVPYSQRYLFNANHNANPNNPN